MSLLTHFNLADLGTPRHATPSAERLVDGDPQFTTWDIEQSADGIATSGVWESTPGAYRSIKGETWEFCSILQGVSEITEDGGDTVTIRAGDTFIMKPGFTGVWRVLETTRKLWVSYN